MSTNGKPPNNRTPYGRNPNARPPAGKPPVGKPSAGEPHGVLDQLGGNSAGVRPEKRNHPVNRTPTNQNSSVRPVRKKGPNKDLIKVLVITLVVMIVSVVVLLGVRNAFDSFDGIFESRRTDDYENGDASPLDDNFAPPPAPIAEIELTGIVYHEHGGHLELPVNGATGWAATSLPLREGPGAAYTLVVNLSPGQGFTIISGSGDWWNVRLPDGVTGWVNNRGCFINLPDVLPSIIYSITNASGSFFRSSGFEIPGITGEVLYYARSYNPRLGREEYIVPAMYLMAQALFVAQQAALVNGETIIVYEVFRPRSAQRAVVSGMQGLMNTNPRVRNYIETPPWHLGWFISTGLSNHQRGSSIDASLGRVRSWELRQTGDFIFTHITGFVEYMTPTDMHELSPMASIVDTPINISTTQILRDTVPMRYSVTSGVVSMQNYFAQAGLTPLASEWWHFDHTPSRNAAASMNILGEFYTETIYSVPPVTASAEAAYDYELHEP